MTAKISNVAELFHRFHQCEMQLKQGRIASCLLAFKEIADRMTGIPLTDKEKKEFHENIGGFLKNLSAHKKFQEIFGEVSFGDSDLNTNLEFVKSMIAAQEEDIVDRVKNEEAASEAQRLEIDNEKQKQQEEIKKKINQAIDYIDSDNLSPAITLVNENDDIRDAVILHYNNLGMQCREAKNFAEAVKNYTKAISASPKEENLHYNIARAYFEEGKRESAEEFLKKALQLNPDFKEGKVFYEYLQKIEPPASGKTNGERVRKSGGFFKKLFVSK